MLSRVCVYVVDINSWTVNCYYRVIVNTAMRGYIRRFAMYPYSIHIHRITMFEFSFILGRRAYFTHIHTHSHTDSNANTCTAQICHLKNILLHSIRCNHRKHATRTHKHKHTHAFTIYREKLDLLWISKDFKVSINLLMEKPFASDAYWGMDELCVSGTCAKSNLVPYQNGIDLSKCDTSIEWFCW